MVKLFSLVVVVLLSSLGALGQRPAALETFASPDGAFQFVYPENYELLAGERILKATQGRHAGIPVCDFSTALVCVIYPIEGQENSRLEAAGFSIDAVQSVTAEPDCLAYADRFERPHGEESQPSPFRMNGVLFRYASARRMTTDHAQYSDLYLTFQKERCYELRIAISLAGDLNAQQPSSSRSLEAAQVDRARESLKLIFSSVIFR
jgi:hypothetical protein